MFWSWQTQRSYYDLLTQRRLVRGIQWSVEIDDPERIVLETVPRFKGLEAVVTFLWLLIDTAQERELLYVGLSRAKSVVYLVGSTAACASVNEGTASPQALAALQLVSPVTSALRGGLGSDVND